MMVNVTRQSRATCYVNDFSKHPEIFGLSSRQRPTSAAKMLLARSNDPLDVCNVNSRTARDMCQAEVLQLPLVAHEETRQPGQLRTVRKRMILPALQQDTYPLGMTNIAMENHYFQWKNPL